MSHSYIRDLVKTIRSNEWLKTAMEILKWALVLWLLWPTRSTIHAQLDFIRVVMGIVLFVIFAGKLFYDILIMDMLLRKRTTIKQDILSFIGMILVISLVVGLMVCFVGFLILQLIQSSVDTGQS